MKLKLSSSLLLAAVLAVPGLCKAQGGALPTDLTNIAAAANGGRVLASTSTLDSDNSYSAANIIDGEVFNGAAGTGSKGWVSNRFDPINMESITLGFRDNTLHKLGKFVFNPASNIAPERWAKDIEVQVSTDTAEGPYRVVQIFTLRRVPEPQTFAILPADARFVRLVFRSNWGSDRAVALGEVEIYEAIDTSDPLGQLISRMQGAVNELRRYRQTQIETSNAGGQDVAATPASRRGKPLSEATVQLVQMVQGGGTRFPVSNRNIAAAANGGQIKAYSSVFDSDPAYGPDKLIDGQNFRMADGQGSFGWASQGFQPGKQFVTIGFQDDRTRLVGKLVLNPVSNQADLRWARRVDVQVTTGSYVDGPWRSVTSLNLKAEPVNQEFIIRPMEAKYIRFVFQANGPGIVLPDADPNVNSDRAVSLGEIEVYEAVSTGDQLDTLIGRFNQILVDLINLRAQQIKGTPDAATPAALRNTKPAAAKVVPVQKPRATRPAPARGTRTTQIAEVLTGNGR